jgi:hypothetical protein
MPSIFQKPGSRYFYISMKVPTGRYNGRGEPEYKWIQKSLKATTLAEAEQACATATLLGEKLAASAQKRRLREKYREVVDALTECDDIPEVSTRAFAATWAETKKRTVAKVTAEAVTKVLGRLVAHLCERAHWTSDLFVIIWSVLA